MQIQLDQTDIKLLKLMQQDTSLTTNELADKIGLSQSPCWRRINRIEQSGIIQKKVALLDTDKLGMEVVIFTSITLNNHSITDLEEFEKRITSFPEVVECYTMTGGIDYMLKIITKDIRRYEIFVRTNLTHVYGIREMHSNVAVTRIKNTTEVPLDTQYL